MSIPCFIDAVAPGAIWGFALALVGRNTRGTYWQAQNRSWKHGAPDLQHACWSRYDGAAGSNIGKRVCGVNGGSETRSR